MHTKKDCKEVSEYLPKWKQTKNSQSQSSERVVSLHQQWKGAESGQLSLRTFHFCVIGSLRVHQGKGAASICQLQ